MKKYVFQICLAKKISGFNKRMEKQAWKFF